MDTKLKTAFSRIGGKSRLADKIISVMPQHKTYVEAFIGGGSIFLKKPLVEKNIINDLDEDIYHLWTDLRDIEAIDFSFNEDNVNKETFYRLKEEKTFSTIRDRLFRNLYLSKISFGAKRETYGFKYITNRKFYEHKYIIKHLADFKYKLGKANIHNQDYKSIIELYDSPDTLFYLDPPYSQQHKAWQYGTPKIDMKEFVNILKSIKGKFIVSYDVNDLDLFKDFIITEVDTIYSYQHKDIKDKKKKEVLITNYEII
jgi:DNA adenine methylase